MWKWMLLLSLILVTHLKAEVKVLAFAGSTREESFNKKLIKEAASLAQEMGAKVTVIDLKDYPIPFYDGDFESKEGMPAKAKQLRQLMMDHAVIFIASPEYNGSISGVLKNDIDWVSRNEEKEASRSAFKGKTFAIMGASMGQSGGARGLVHLRAIIEGIGGKVITQQVTVPEAHLAFDENGQLKDPKLKTQLQALVKAALNQQS